jgi:hypothetical protein
MFQKFHGDFLLHPKKELISQSHFETFLGGLLYFAAHKKSFFSRSIVIIEQSSNGNQNFM